MLNGLTEFSKNSTVGYNNLTIKRYLKTCKRGFRTKGFDHRGVDTKGR